MNRVIDRSCAAVSVLALGFTLQAGAAAAQDARNDGTRYPSAPIRAVVPYAPGGGTDILARQIGARLSERLGQSVVIDNRAGGATVIGTDIVARAPADGYTLLITTGTHAVNATLHPKLPFDPIRSFAPVSLLATAPNVLVVHPSTPVKRVSELVGLAKRRPGELSYSSSGNGGTGHLAMELLKQTAGLDIVHIPYKGAGPAVTAVVSGEVALSITNLIAALPQIKAQRLRALAVTSARPSAVLPDVPTIADSGFPGFDASGWFAVFAPAGTPAPIIDKLSDAIRAVLDLPEVRQHLAAQGAEASASSPEELAERVRVEVERWRRVLSHANIKRG